VNPWSWLDENRAIKNPPQQLWPALVRGRERKTIRRTQKANYGTSCRLRKNRAQDRCLLINK
jgi:hypothetical protein